MSTKLTKKELDLITFSTNEDPFKSKIRTLCNSLDLKCKFSENKIQWFKPLKIHLNYDPLDVKTLISCKVFETSQKLTSSEEDLLKSSLNEICELTEKEVKEKIEKEIAFLYSSYEHDLSLDDLKVLDRELKSFFVKKRKLEDISLFKIKSYFSSGLKAELKRIDSEKVEKELGLKDYCESFEMARAIKRNFEFRLGPTNSGKTYEALESLKSAKSGIYLAPLRLLAMEAYDALTAAGVKCNLITGEEKIIVPEATHLSCTVEMLNPEIHYEVGVIDEIQMIADPDRGWAWTAALVGLACKTVFLCGSDAALEPCVRTIKSLGDSFNIKYLTRKSKLEVQHKVDLKNSIALKEFNAQKGDAIIAFSRKEVLKLTAFYRNKGFKVACIYGALSPEVRRSQAYLFNSGKADILVATDAIGMGLNLPIKRVVFSSVEKFNGTFKTQLSESEIKQIAGRAGRFGIYDTGFVNAFSTEALNFVKTALSMESEKYKEKLYIAPNLKHILTLGSYLRTDSIFEIIEYFTHHISLNDPNFKIAHLEDLLRTAEVVDTHGKELSLENKFLFSCAPTSSKEEDMDFFINCLNAFKSKAKVYVPSLSQRGIKKGSFDVLWRAEQFSRDLNLFSWLSLKFPDVFDDSFIPETRSEVTELIKEELMKHK